jgi:hypothetical protein
MDDSIVLYHWMKVVRNACIEKYKINKIKIQVAPETERNFLDTLVLNQLTHKPLPLLYI